MSNFLTIDPVDNPNEGRVKINYNFSIIALSGGTGSSGNFLPLSGGTVSGTTNFNNGAQLQSGGTDLYNIFSTGGTPGGSNTQIQFNDSSAFGGSSSLTFDKTLFTSKFAGSGHTLASNVVTSAMIAGRNNTLCASSSLSIMAAGFSNTLSGGTASSMIGGTSNRVCGSNQSSMIGGTSNCLTSSVDSSIQGSKFACLFNTNQSVVSGAYSGKIYCSNKSAVLGGTSVGICGSAHNSSVIGGEQNYIDGAIRSSIIGGGLNTIVSSTHGIIAGSFTSHINGTGDVNFISATRNSTLSNSKNSAIIGNTTSNLDGGYSSGALFGKYLSVGNITGGTLIGGSGSTLYGSNYSSIVGGISASIYCSKSSSIIGGCFNRIESNSCYSSIIGGVASCVSTSTRSVIIGGSALTLTNIFDTVYVPQLKISSATTNNSLTTFLGRDVDGNVNEKAISAITVSQNVQVFSGAMTSKFIDVATSPNAKIYVPSNNVNVRLSGFTSGSTGNITLLQNAVGGGTITLTGASFSNYIVNGGGGTINLTQTANARDVISYYSDDGINLYWSAGFNYT
jgi:hypothetical protein